MSVKTSPPEAGPHALRLGGVTEPIVQRLVLIRERSTEVAALALWRGPDPGMGGLALHAHEIERSAGMRFARRRHDYVLGRHVARCALGELAGAHDAGRSPIASGVFEQPVLEGPAAARLDVSIAHTGGLAAAVAFPRAHPLGLDLECVDPERSDVLAAHASSRELALLDGLGLDALEAVTRLWTAKEALAKVLRTGLTVPLELYEVASAERDHEHVRFTFTTFMQYAAQTLAGRRHCLALCLPRRTHTRLEADWLQRAEAPGA